MEKIEKNSTALEPLGGKRDNFEIDRYNEVSRRARLAEITLTNSEFNAKMDAGAILSNPAGSVRLSYTDTLTEVMFDRNAGILAGLFNWKAEIKSGRTSLVRLRAAYSIFYDNLVEAEEDYAVAYLAKAGRFATYPYFRGMFSIHVGAASLIVPPLPSLRERVD